MSRKRIWKGLRTEIAFPIIILTLCGSSLGWMVLAGDAREANPAWYLASRAFLAGMVGFSIIDLLMIRRRVLRKMPIDAIPDHDTKIQKAAKKIRMLREVR